MRKSTILFWSLMTFLLPLFAFADFEGTLANLVNAVLGRILPVLSLGYVGKNIFAHIQSKPEATQETLRVGFAVVALLGVRAVWSFLQAQVR